MTVRSHVEEWMMPTIPDTGRDFTATNKRHVQFTMKAQWLKWTHSPDYEQEAA
jgi:hypothetical protein